MNDAVDVAEAAHGQFRADVFHDVVGQIARHFRFDESGRDVIALTKVGYPFSPA